MTPCVLIEFPRKVLSVSYKTLIMLGIFGGSEDEEPVDYITLLEWFRKTLDYMWLNNNWCTAYERPVGLQLPPRLVKRCSNGWIS